ncbi:uncharacterized protein LOC131622501 [Vicia villosa]|uniref:uncharacterized protein LOC131622501 n=1 Tax=Vicia villosa TaxID=3911 RepID=UPI00273C480A|nr:uncharacterized protein LOC131622501 [Vicia villosa]
MGDGRSIAVMNEPWCRGSNNSRFIVPLLEDVMENKIIWKEERDGEYCVRSGYRIWCNEFRRHNSGTVNEDWRCEFCDHHTEDERHLFLGCDATNLCWRSSGLSNILDSRLHLSTNFKEIIFDICKKEDKKLARRFAVMLELIWKNRNDFIWHQEHEEASKMGLCASHRWNDWFHAQDVNGNNAQSPHDLEWRPPSISIAWDPGTLSLVEAEALALKEAILGALDKPELCYFLE